MNGGQQLVGALGVGLIAVNAWTGPQRAQLTAIASSQPGDAAASHTALKHLGAEVLGVGALTLIAGASEGAEHVAALVLVALWVIWLLRRYGKGGAVATAGLTAAHPSPAVVPPHTQTAGLVAGHP